MLTPRLLLQECWQRNIGWSEVMTSKMVEQWTEWLKMVKDCNETQFDRALILEQVRDEDVQVHAFCDASKVAYAAVVYIRTLGQYQVHTRFAASKMKVKTLRTCQTIPRMELMGVELGVRAAVKVAKAAGIPLQNVYAWTDSKAVFDWVRIEGQSMNAFVQNRTEKITQKIPAYRVGWVPGTENPADLATRPISMALLDKSNWKEGPHF
jgi:ribonuclease HI